RSPCRPRSSSVLMRCGTSSGFEHSGCPTRGSSRNGQPDRWRVPVRRSIANTTLGIIVRQLAREFFTAFKQRQVIGIKEQLDAVAWRLREVDHLGAGLHTNLLECRLQVVKTLL